MKVEMSLSNELKRLTDLPQATRPVLVGEEIKAYLSNVESPRKIALQPLTNEPDLDRLEDLLLNLPELGPSVDSVTPGTIWGALYSADGLWYRGVVKRLDEKNKKAEICFIDYGNVDMVDIETGLRYLSADLLKFPPMVFEAQWLHAPHCSDAFKTLSDLIETDQPITVTIVERKVVPIDVSLVLGTAEDGPFVVIINELSDSKKNANESALDQTPLTEPPQSEKKPDVGGSEESVDYAAQIQFINAQRAQVENLTVKLKAMEAEMKDLKAKVDEGPVILIPGLSVSSSSRQLDLIGMVLFLGKLIQDKDELAIQNAKAWEKERVNISQMLKMQEDWNMSLRYSMGP